LELDENFRRLVKELGYAINETLGDSERISEVMGRIRAAGYDLFLILEVTIGFNKRGGTDLLHRQKFTSGKHREAEFHLTNEDARFLSSLKISVDEEEH
jgi:hypothetical protein